MAVPYLSIDIGAKHLALCEASHGGQEAGVRVTDMKLLTMEEATVEQSVRNVIALLNDTCEVIEVGTVVLIERQVIHNVKAMALGYAVMAFFLSRGLTVKMCSANIKPLTASGKKRKRDAIEVAKTMLQGTMWYDKLLAFPKKDDVADAYLQLVGFTNRLP
jgi:hypothetical protein